MVGINVHVYIWRCHSFSAYFNIKDTKFKLSFYPKKTFMNYSGNSIYLITAMQSHETARHLSSEWNFLSSILTI